MPTFRGKKVYRKRPAMAKKAQAKKYANAAFRKRVMSIVNRGRERKIKVYNLMVDNVCRGSGLRGYGNQGQHKGLFVNALDSLNLANGAQQDQRVGNRITNCKLNIRGFVRTEPFDSTSNSSILPYEVKVVVFKNKFNSDNNYLYLKHDINNTSGQITGDAMNTLRPFNRDLYQIKKVITLRLSPQPSVDLHTVTGDTQDAISLNGNTSTYPTFRRFSANIPIKKNIAFQDGSNLPANEWIGVVAYVISGDGVEQSETVAKCKVSMDAYFSFEDA